MSKDIIKVEFDFDKNIYTFITDLDSIEMLSVADITLISEHLKDYLIKLKKQKP
jgi:hypothetical protein